MSTAHATSAKVISLKLYLVFPSPSLPISYLSLLPHLYLYLSFFLFSLFFSPETLSLSILTPNTHTHTQDDKARLSSEHEDHRRFAPCRSHLFRQARRNVFSLLLTRAYHPSEHITPPSISPLRHFLSFFLSLSLSLSLSRSKYTHKQYLFFLLGCVLDVCNRKSG